MSQTAFMKPKLPESQLAVDLETHLGQRVYRQRVLACNPSDKADEVIGVASSALARFACETGCDPASCH